MDDSRNAESDLRHDIEKVLLRHGLGDSRPVVIVLLPPVESSLASVEQTNVVCGFLELHPEVKQAYWKGQKVTLAVSLYDIVHALVVRPGEIVAYRQLYNAVRGVNFHAGYGEEGYRGNVRTLIKRVRRSFLAVDPEFNQIENRHSVGYVWQKEK